VKSYTLPINLKLNGKSTSQDIGYAGVARSFLGKMLEVNAADPVGQKWNLTLQDGTTISAYVPATGMLPIVNIQTPLILEDEEVESNFCYVGLVSTPVAKEYTLGWGLPLDEPSTVLPLGTPLLAGSEFLSRRETLFSANPAFKKQTNTIPIMYRQDFEEVPSADYFNSYISEENKVYTWGVYKQYDFLGANRYHGKGSNGTFYRCGKPWLVCPSTDIRGMAIFEGYVYVVTVINASCFVSRRVFQDTYTPEEMQELYHPESSPNGWHLHIAEYVLPPLYFQDGNIDPQEMFFVGQFLGSKTTGEMVGGVGRVAFGVRYPYEYVKIDLSDTPTFSFVGETTVPLFLEPELTLTTPSTGTSNGYTRRIFDNGATQETLVVDGVTTSFNTGDILGTQYIVSYEEEFTYTSTVDYQYQRDEYTESTNTLFVDYKEDTLVVVPIVTTQEGLVFGGGSTANTHVRSDITYTFDGVNNYRVLSITTTTSNSSMNEFYEGGGFKSEFTIPGGDVEVLWGRDTYRLPYDISENTVQVNTITYTNPTDTGTSVVVNTGGVTGNFDLRGGDVETRSKVEFLDLRTGTSVISKRVDNRIPLSCDVGSIVPGSDPQKINYTEVREQNYEFSLKYNKGKDGGQVYSLLSDTLTSSREREAFTRGITGPYTPFTSGGGPVRFVTAISRLPYWGSYLKPGECQIDHSGDVLITTRTPELIYGETLNDFFPIKEVFVIVNDTEPFINLYSKYMDIEGTVGAYGTDFTCTNKKLI
jgi:hypothetical protein